MSLSRRQLFTRLSAVALAPLVKWLPKEEPKFFTGMVCDVAVFPKPLTVAELSAYYDLPELTGIVTAVPQEEA